MALILSNTIQPEENCIHHIFENIYLGNCDARRYIQKYNISRVLEIGEREELETYLPIDIEKMSIVISDRRDADISVHFNSACDFISKDNNPVLVHCKAGVSRSVTIVASYLIKKGYTVEEALKLIEMKRGDKIYTHPNFGFLKLLKKW
jgi:predicted protein tyrosine phosphatase